jgi:hypothetical protein
MVTLAKIWTWSLCLESSGFSPQYLGIGEGNICHFSKYGQHRDRHPLNMHLELVISLLKKSFLSGHSQRLKLYQVIIISIIAVSTYFLSHSLSPIFPPTPPQLLIYTSLVGNTWWSLDKVRDVYNGHGPSFMVYCFIYFYQKSP